MHMTRTFGWQRFYEEAVLETNRAELVRRIHAAQAAIDARISQLQSDHQDSNDERQAIEDAQAGLRVLREEALKRPSSPRADGRH
jgi:hypothetical protein